MANLFHGESGPFGLFDVNGVPEKNYYALLAFAELMKTPRRVRIESAGAFYATAGLSAAGTNAAILISNLSEAHSPLVVAYKNLPAPGKWRARLRVVDATHDLEPVMDAVFAEGSVHFTVRRSAVALISLERVE